MGKRIEGAKLICNDNFDCLLNDSERFQNEEPKTLVELIQAYNLFECHTIAKAALLATSVTRRY